MGTRFGGADKNVVTVRNIILPNIEFATELPKTEHFSLFIDKHKEIAAQLINILVAQPDIDTLTSIAVYIRDRVNPYLFQYALSVTILHRNDTDNIDVPALTQLFPDSFVDPSVFSKLKEESNVAPQKRVS